MTLNGLDLTYVQGKRIPYIQSVTYLNALCGGRSIKAKDKMCPQNINYTRQSC